MSDRSLLIIFAKAPIAGEVNTRLIPDIGIDAATQLQSELIDTRMRQFGNISEYDVQLWCSPDITHQSFRQCLDKYNITLHQQQGADLGSRILHAFASAFKCEQYDKVALIGTDAPALNPGMVVRSMDALDTHDVVIVPAEDGGYVLVAMRQLYKEVFLTVPWGTANVLRRTRGNIVAQALKYKELEICWDIDLVADYQRYQGTFKSEGYGV